MKNLPSTERTISIITAKNNRALLAIFWLASILLIGKGEGSTGENTSKQPEAGNAAAAVSIQSLPPNPVSITSKTIVLGSLIGFKLELGKLAGDFTEVFTARNKSLAANESFDLKPWDNQLWIKRPSFSSMKY